MEGEATWRITFNGPIGIGKAPYIFVFAFIENEPVVLVSKPSFSID